jgi:hypothetical protein
LQERRLGPLTPVAFRLEAIVRLLESGCALADQAFELFSGPLLGFKIGPSFVLPSASPLRGQNRRLK